MMKRFFLLAALAAAAIGPVRADEPASPSPAPKLIQKVLRSTDYRRNWTVAYTLSGSKLSIHCQKSDTGRCGVRVIDAPRLDAPATELQIEWLGLKTGDWAMRTLKGKAYAICIQPDVGRDDACEPLDALTAL